MLGVLLSHFEDFLGVGVSPIRRLGVGSTHCLGVGVASVNLCLEGV